MRKDMLSKILVMVVIILFLGTNVVSSVGNRVNDFYNIGIKDNAPEDEPIWSWVVSAGGTSGDAGKAINVDSYGNSYVLGKFSNSASFGSIVLASKGSYDFFVAKLDINSNWLWAVSGGGRGQEWVGEIYVDSIGNSYITGCFHNTASFGNINLTSKGEWDIFIAKLDTNGTWLWAVSTGGKDNDIGSGVSVDSNGEIYLTGRFQDTVSFGSTFLTSKGYYDIFVAKLDKKGNWLWAVSAGGSSEDCGLDINLDSCKNSYITGWFIYTISLGDIILTSNGSFDVFVAKLDMNGTWLWAENAGGPSSDAGKCISVDFLGNSYIICTFKETALFGNINITSNGNKDVFIAKLDSNGKWLWAKSGGGYHGDYGWGIGVDSSGNPYITGEFYGSGWFGSTYLVSKGRWDVFIAMLDTNGNWLWAISAGGKGQDDRGWSINVDSNGNSYVTGEFYDEALFDDIILTSNGYGDVFIAKLNPGENKPPNPPSIDGQKRGKVGVKYEYNFYLSDVDNNLMYLRVDWGNGTSGPWLGPYTSGSIIKLDHSWNQQGTFTIRAQTKDIHDTESKWGELTVTMPRNKAVSNNIFLQRLLERFPLLQKLILLIRN